MKIKSLLLFILIICACQSDESNLSSDIVVPVSVEEITLKPIQQFVSTTGTVEAIKEAVLITESTGYYHLAVDSKNNRPITMGSSVKKDQIIVELNNPELESTIKIESQKLNLDISKREFEKQQSLYEKGGVTLRELKNAERTYIDAQYNFDNAKIQLDKLKITAPFDGILVDLKYITENTKVETNTEIGKIMDYSQLFTEVNLPHREMTRVNIDQKVRVMNYAFPEDTLWGKVTQLAPAIDPSSRTFKVTILIDNPELTVRPGMFMQIEIIVAAKEEAIVIPKSVIIYRRGEKRIFVVEKGAALERVVSTGLENREQIEIVDGLKKNERLVIKGFETLRHRSKVKIIR